MAPDLLDSGGMQRFALFVVALGGLGVGLGCGSTSGNTDGGNAGGGSAPAGGHGGGGVGGTTGSGGSGPGSGGHIGGSTGAAGGAGGVTGSGGSGGACAACTQTTAIAVCPSGVSAGAQCNSPQTCCDGEREWVCGDCGNVSCTWRQSCGSTGGGGATGGAGGVGGSRGAGGAGGNQMYGCGSDTCTVGDSFCYSFTPGTAGPAGLSCQPTPAACASTPASCACLCPPSSNTGFGCVPAGTAAVNFCSCSDAGGLVKVSCAGS